MAVDIQILKPLDTLSDLTGDELGQLAVLAENLPVIEKEVLANKGAFAQTLFINLTGNFMVVFEAERAMTIHTPGAFLGVSSMVPPFIHEGTTVALTRGEVLSVPGPDLRRIIDSEPGLGDKLMRPIDAARGHREALLQR